MTTTTMKLEDICCVLYAKFGAGAVREFVNGLDGVSYLYCAKCESWEPFYEGDCLICGTPRRVARHTPGPWTVDFGGFPLIVNGPDMVPADGNEPANVVCLVDSRQNDGTNHYDTDIAIANATLIQFAPEMLLLLERLCHSFDCGSGLGPLMDEVGVLIARAKGEDETRD